ELRTGVARDGDDHVYVETAFAGARAYRHGGTPVEDGRPALLRRTRFPKPTRVGTRDRQNADAQDLDMLVFRKIVEAPAGDYFRMLHPGVEWIQTIEQRR